MGFLLGACSSGFSSDFSLLPSLKLYMEVRLNIKLHENQNLVHQNARKFNVIKAGKRFGKTKLAIYRALQKAGDTPNGCVWYVAPTYRQAKSIAWYELINMVPYAMIKRKIENDLLLELFNGCRFQLIGAENDDSLRGPKLDHVVMDEAAYIKEYIWPSIISGQLMGIDGRGSADFISSPNKDGRNWFTGFYEAAKAKMDAGDPDWTAHYFTIYDNPTYSREDIEKLKDANTEDRWQLEYMAVESAYAGLIYSEFNYVNHVKQMDTQGGNWVLVRGLDWGISHPTACLFIYVNPLTRQIYVADEFMRSDMVIEESAHLVRQMTGDRKVEWSVIDPSTAKRNSQTGRRDMDEFIRHGVGVVPGDNRDRGYDITKMFFKKDMVRVHPKCRNLINQLRNLQRGDKLDDDMTDCLRYACVRIHDFMFGGNLFPKEEAKVVRAPNVFNFNDSLFKMKANPRDMSWACAESNDYEEVA